MSIDQEAPESQVEAEAEIENETVNEELPHTEVGEHEYTIEELRQELEEAKQKAHDNWDKAVRTQAEMENLKRRTQKDLEDAHRFALTSFAKALLPVYDSLVLGLQAATGDSEDVKKFREGSELTIKQFEALFPKFNIVAIDPLGQPFNAEQHQAMLMQAVEGAEPNTVVNVFQKGYMLNGRLLRPAMVVVAKAAEKPSEDNA
jgi:molecular chaperone GrpE